MPGFLKASKGEPFGDCRGKILHMLDALSVTRVRSDIQIPFSRSFQELQRTNSRVIQDSTNSFSRTFQDTFHSRGNKLHTMYYNEFLVYWAILSAEIKNSRITAFEFQDFSRVFQDLGFFPGLSRPGNLNILIPGLSRICRNAVSPKQQRQCTERTEWGLLTSCSPSYKDSDVPHIKRYFSGAQEQFCPEALLNDINDSYRWQWDSKPGLLG